jgi:cytochrome o ubiquinol oxidase operon protein cyoD
MNAQLERAESDRAPGSYQSSGDRFKSYAIGLALAVVLTAASFAVSTSDLVWGPSIPVLLAVLAIAQMGVHLVFFLHISTAADSTNNILALAFGIFVTGLVIFGSMIIISNLNHNMMPTDQLMDMHTQR